jgi:hypothetical protein
LQLAKFDESPLLSGLFVFAKARAMWPTAGPSIAAPI